MLYRRYIGSITKMTKINIERSPSPKKSGIIIPLYFYPYDANNSNWNISFQNLLSLLFKYKDLPSVVIVNPNNGAGDTEDPNWTKAMELLKGTASIVLGYVYTNYGNRDVAEVINDIQHWKDLYPKIDGIFLDEVSPNINTLPYYKDISNNIRSLGFNFVFGNAGIYINKQFFEGKIFDNVVIYEDSQLPLITDIEQYNDIEFTKKSVIVHSQNNLDINYIRQIQDYIGYIYITDKTLPNPYNDIPIYLETLLLILNTQPEILTFTPDGKVGIKNINPLSTLDILGSLSLPNIVIDTNYSLTNNDFTVLVDTTSGNVNLDLPTPQESKNRIYLIKKISRDNNAISIRVNGQELLSILEPDRSILIQNNGTDWKVIIDSLSANGSGGSGGNVSVDKITIDYNNLAQLYVKDDAITAQKIAPNVDVSNKGFNADMIDGRHVNDNDKLDSLWTGKRITKEAIIKSIIFG